MKNAACLLFACVLVLTSCNKTPNPFQGAVAAWRFTNLDDEAGLNSRLQQHGPATFVTINNKEKSAGGKSGSEGKAVYLNGTSWLDAGQGINNELNITGKNFTLFARVKPGVIKEFNPIISKSGNDQQIAYRIALRKKEDGLYVEATLGSDDIGGAHVLMYKIPKEQWLTWHDILFRFNGKLSELYVDAILRDNEVTEGEARDWNHSPVLIGAEYKEPYVTGDSTSNSIAYTFTGWVDCVAIWSEYLPDDRVASLSGAAALKKDGLPVYYSEKYRPQFHFTAKKNWLNDPNGLVYYNGTYHLFFQYMPSNRPGAYKDWGHATSTDLVHWQQVPQHITPHKVWGGCWSGSAVVDENNMSGFKSTKEKPIVAFITNGGNPGDGIGPACTQNIAYSTDGGMTFTYYDGNPVIKNINGSNRDPKVAWDEQSKKWIMSLYMDKDNDFGLFASTNLRDWEQLSTVSLKGIVECPGFEPFALDGDSNNKKWVFSGASGSYKVGSFDGKRFKPETDVIVGDYGNNFYAPQIWSNAPGGRHIQIAWMPTNKYPGMPFEQQMNFPTELTLKSTPAGMRLYRIPVAEIKNLYNSAITWQKTVSGQGDNLLKDLKGDLYDIALEIDLKKSTAVQIGIRGAVITYDAVNKKLSCGGPAVKNGFPPENWNSYSIKQKSQLNNMGEAPLAPVNGRIKLRILVDRTTLEIFGNDGQVVISSCFAPGEANSYNLTNNGEIDVTAEIHSLKSAWNQ